MIPIWYAGALPRESSEPSVVSSEILYAGVPYPKDGHKYPKDVHKPPHPRDGVYVNISVRCKGRRLFTLVDVIASEAKQSTEAKRIASGFHPSQ